ncbi:hypothetical protein [Dyella koreensis]|uniref:Uncharacterized protein n=1 Tax=Dyella koreensis TaxID=311235 RepID=A0ABW8K8I4_9GAMM
MRNIAATFRLGSYVLDVVEISHPVYPEAKQWMPEIARDLGHGQRGRPVWDGSRSYTDLQSAIDVGRARLNELAREG